MKSYQRPAERVPVFERTLKNDDFPTLGRPNVAQIKMGGCMKSSFDKQTYDADLQIVTGATKKGLLLGTCIFLGRHSLLYDGARK